MKKAPKPELCILQHRLQVKSLHDPKYFESWDLWYVMILASRIVLALTGKLGFIGEKSNYGDVTNSYEGSPEW